MNLEEVARRAKVSTATVSRVLNKSTAVKGATRDRVMKAVNELNYMPNLHARSLAIGKTRSLGIIVSNMENPFFYDVVCQIEADAHAHGYEVIVSNTNYEAEQLARNVRLMAGRRVAGLAAIVSEMDPDLLQDLAGARIPVVFYDVGPNAENVGRVRLNYRKGMYRLADYLIAMGHDRCVAWLGHHRDYPPLKERREALIEAYERLAPNADVRTFAGKDNLEGGWQVAREMLQSGFKPTAVVCANDFMAVGVLRALRENGISVPQDMSVTGLDNIKLAEFCYPTLTTVHVPRDRVGQLIFEKLISGIDAPGFGTELLIDPDLVIRDSTGPALKS
jgi:DNA-binding LacI/PurR family transcriptional regulator